MATFIPGALPGETVLAEIVQKKKSFQRGLLTEVLKPASDRIDAPCSVFEDCGGCQLQHLNYNASLAWKQSRVVGVLERIGKLPGVKVHPVLGMAEPWRYRNKVQLQGGRAGGKAALGYFSSKTNRLVPFADCLLLPQVFNRLKDYVQEFLHSNWPGMRAKQVVIRRSAATGEVMLGVVGECPPLPWEDILNRFPQVKSIVVVDPAARQTRLVAGKSKIHDTIFGNHFMLSFQSFTQVNPTQTEVLYAKALEYAGLTGNQTVADVYCGIGTITLALAAQARKAVGVEIIQQAVLDARENARRNGVDNVEFYAGPAELVLPRLAAEGLRADVAVVDPPRAGCEQAALEAIVEMGPRRIVYVSCDPATLARDLAWLKERGYDPVEVQPVDMFPWTAHVETVVLIERK